jgi:hypothetical protein
MNLPTGRPCPPLVSPQTESALRWDPIGKQDVKSPTTIQKYKNTILNLHTFCTYQERF